MDILNKKSKGKNSNNNVMFINKIIVSFHFL